MKESYRKDWQEFTGRALQVVETVVIDNSVK